MNNYSGLSDDIKINSHDPRPYGEFLLLSYNIKTGRTTLETDRGGSLRKLSAWIYSRGMVMTYRVVFGLVL